MDRDEIRASGDYLPGIYRHLRTAHGDVLAAYDTLAVACRQAGPLSAREQRFVKLGIAIGLASQGGVRSHVRRAIDEGIDDDAILHAILLAVPTAGFPAMSAAYEWAREVLDRQEERPDDE